MTKLRECLQDQYGNYLYPFFWQVGAPDEALIEEIRAIHECGIGAVCVENAGHPEYFEDGWWHTIDLILDECKKRGMKVWILDDRHFPSGWGDGIVVKKYPEKKMWCMTEVHMDVAGPLKDGAVCFDRKLWNVAEEDVLLGVIACKRAPSKERRELVTGEVIDVSYRVKDDMVYMDLPEGAYRIVFLLKTRRGLHKRLSEYPDKLDAFCGDVVIEAVYEPYYEKYKHEFGKTLAGFFSDEPCFCNGTHVSYAPHVEPLLGKKYSFFPYSDEMFAELDKRLGGRAKELLPMLWFDSTDPTAASTRVIYMDLITELYSRNFCQKLGDWCRAHGVTYAGHVVEDDDLHTKTRWSAGHFFRCMDGQDISGIDVVLNQLIPGMSDYGNTGAASHDFMNNELYHFTLPKLAVSHAHIQESKQGRALCEIFGAFGWNEGLKMQKWMADFMLVRGINHFVPHGFRPQQNDLSFAPHFYRMGKNPEYKDFGLITRHMNRVSHLTNGGVHVSSAALLYHAHAEWANGEGGYMNENTVVRYLTEHVIDFDIVPEDYLYDARVENGMLCLAKKRIPCFIIPWAKTLPRRLIDTFIRFAKEGLPVFALEDYPRVMETGEESGLAAAGVELVALDDLDATLRARGFAEITLDTPERHLRFSHFKHADADYYLLSNEKHDQPIKVSLNFRDFPSGECIKYDPTGNTATKITFDGAIGLTLDPCAMTVLAFGESTEGLEEEKHFETVGETPLALTWDISVASHEDLATEKPLCTTAELFNINGEKGDCRFGGYVFYRSSFDCAGKGDRMLIDLGYVGETAHLTLNGKEIGVKLAPPYVFDVTDHLKVGKNDIEVKVVTNLGFAIRDVFSRFQVFEATGLLGPVCIREQKTK